VEERLTLYLGLRRGAVDRLTEFRWPVPSGAAAGAWVQAGADAPADAVRGYPLAEIAWGLDDELWQLELDGARTGDRRAVHGRRGRLVERIRAWEASTAAGLIEVCAWRVRDAAVAEFRAEERPDEAEALALVEDLMMLEQLGNAMANGTGAGSRLAGFAADVVLYARDAGSPAGGAAVAAYIAAHALAGGDKNVRAYEAKFETERGWQAEWLRRRLEL
jgi:hypothetical protein